ncbi:unnamed protein product [Closterium sp. Naga37s-1]|nr:unnamed protein product [Closterium sp. Naga37s-1]
MSRDTTSRSGGASPAAAISPPPSSSFPATSVFLPALLLLGVDLSDDPDDREQVVAQGLAHDQAKAAQGRRHRRTGSLDTMLLAKPGVASGKGVSSVKSIGDGTTTTRRTTGNSGTITARSAAAIEAGSMAGGSKKDDAIPGEATPFSATSVSEESDTSSSSSSSSRHDPTGFKGFQPVPTTAQPAAGSPKPVVFGSARFSESSGLKGFKPAFLRLGDDLGDDPDDWDWLAGGQQQTWSNPGGPQGLENELVNGSEKGHGEGKEGRGIGEERVRHKEKIGDYRMSCSGELPSAYLLALLTKSMLI